MYLLAELWQSKAVMRSPIPIEPVHSFSHGHHDQQHNWLTGMYVLTTTTSQNMAAILVNLRMRLTPLQFDIQDPFNGQWHLLTSIT